MGNKKFIFILLFIFIFTIGCSKNDNSEEEKSVDYINEHLNASRYTNFTLQKTIKSDDVILLEKNITSTLANSVYTIVTIEKKLDITNSDGLYSITTSETKKMSIENPISLNLQEEYFDEVSITSKKLIGIINEEYSEDALGITNVTDITLNIILNDSLKVQSITVSYIDKSGYNILINVMYNY